MEWNLLMATPLSPKLEWPLMNPILASTLNPLIANPLNYCQLLQNISLVSGVNVINHKLGRQMVGWFFTDIQGIASVYRSGLLNAFTLTLTSNAPVLVSIGVF
jgi:hypothetical protein